MNSSNAFRTRFVFYGLIGPLLFACLAGLFSERAGIFDIGLEGKMLAAAFAAGAGAAVWHSAWAGLLVAILVSVGLSIVHGFASITAKGNQIVSGVAINFTAAGLTALLGQSWFQQGGKTPRITREHGRKTFELHRLFGPRYCDSCPQSQ